MGGWSFSWQVLRNKELNGMGLAIRYIYIIFFFAKLYIDIDGTLILHKKKKLDFYIIFLIIFFFRATKIGSGWGNPNFGAALTLTKSISALLHIPLWQTGLLRDIIEHSLT